MNDENKMPIGLLERNRWNDDAAAYMLKGYIGFWDTALRLWTITRQDAGGNQIGCAEYFNNKFDYSVQSFKDNA